MLLLLLLLLLWLQFIGGQASGCCGRFVCVGTALRVCLVPRAASPAAAAAAAAAAAGRGAQLQQPLLDEATLNAAHAHVEASLQLPDSFKTNPEMMQRLQEPLGKKESKIQTAAAAAATLPAAAAAAAVAAAVVPRLLQGAAS